MKQPWILPKPQRMVWREGFLEEGDDCIGYRREKALGEEAYRIRIDRKKADVEYGGERGKFYAEQTIKQIRHQSSGKLPCCEIEDAPGLAHRGFLMDISRGKVPKLETLFALTDLLALLKINQLQLYIEGFSFAYPSYPEVWEGRTPITPEELRRLDAYCAERHIELVPCQNTLGHMDAWLAREEFAHLAETEEHLQFMGYDVAPSTLNPMDEGSLKLIQTMTDDLLPCFTSDKYNVCLDEAVNLGTGKSRELSGGADVGEIYCNYVKKLHQLVSGRGKNMMMWADFPDRFPGIIDDLPKDITLLEWGYEAAYPFEKRLSVLREKGVPFYVCPGTSSWSSYAGITDNMIRNINAAADAAYKYGAEGLLLTDWGDGGHPQYLSISYSPIALGASRAWNAAPLSEEEWTGWLDAMVFDDREGGMAQLALELGRYQKFEPFVFPGRTLTSFLAPIGPLSSGQMEGLVQQCALMLQSTVAEEVFGEFKESFDRRKPFDYEGMISFLEALARRFSEKPLTGGEGALIKREYENTVRILLSLALSMQLADRRGEMREEEVLRMEKNAAELLGKVIADHETLWMTRNKSYGLRESLGVFCRLRQYFISENESEEQ